MLFFFVLILLHQACFGLLNILSNTQINFRIYLSKLKEMCFTYASQSKTILIMTFFIFQLINNNILTNNNINDINNLLT